MKKVLKKILRIGAGIALFLILVSIIAVILVLFDKPLIRNISQKYLTKTTGFTIEIGKLDYSFSPLSFKISYLKVFQETQIYKLEVSLQELEAKGQFSRLMKQKKPVFDTIHVDRSEVRLQIKKFLDEEVDYQKVIMEAVKALGYAKKITVKESNIMAVFPAQSLSLAKTNLELANAGLENMYALNIASEKIRLQNNNKAFSYESGLDFSGTISLSEKTLVNGRLTLGAPSLTAPEGTESLETVTMEVDGEWIPDEKKISFARLALDIPELTEASGSLAVDYNKGISLLVNSKARVEDVYSILTHLQSYLPPELKNIHLQGKIRVQGTYQLVQNAQGRQEKLEALLGLERIRLQYAKAGFLLQAELGGRLAVNGPLSDLWVSGAVQSNIESLSRNDIGVRNSRLNMQVKAGRNSATIPYFDGTMRNVILPLKGKTLSFEEVKVKGRWSLDFIRRNFTLDFLEVLLPPLTPLQISAKLGLTARGEKYVSLKSAGLKLSALRNLFSSFLPSNLSGWDFDALCDFSAEAKNSRPKTDTWNFSTLFKITDGKFNDPLFTIAGAGLQPIIRLEGIYRPPKNDLSFSGSLELAQGESLWKDFYISWNKYPVRANISGVYNIPAKSIEATTWSFSSPLLGEVHGSGEVSFQLPFSGNLKTRSRLSLDSLYSLFSKAGTPQENRVDLKGKLDGDIQILKDREGFSIKGGLTLNEASLENKKAGFFIRGITAEIPVHLETGRTENDGRGETPPYYKGFFRARLFRTQFITFQPPELILLSGKNAFQIEPLSLEILGGKLELGKTSVFMDPRARALSGLSSLRLKDIDISRIPINPGQFQLNGKGRAAFPRVEINPQKIMAQGEGEIDIFGGKVTIKDISIADPFSKAGAVTFNVDLIDLDLKRITDSVPFGEVTGVIRGEIRDLTFSYGQPERFVLKLESVKKRGVPQRFSLKAVDNLTVISSGQQASIGSSKLWMRFVRGFRYDKIGIMSTLKNDTFTLNGTIKEDGIEYLVKKPWLFGINVINRMPEKKISFREMTQRLKRVGQSDK